MTISYRLVYPAVDASPPLTAGQQAVAGHRAGVLTVLGGPRTGKTTALRHAALGAAADGAGVWFFAGSRRARLDVAAWIGRVSPPAASRVWATTFYSFSQSVLQQYASESVTVLAAARQDAYVREILAGQAPAAWPERFAPARGTPAFAASVREAIAACQREGLTPADVRARGAAEGRDDWVALAGFFEEYLDILGLAAVQDYGELLIRAGEVLRDERVLAEVRPPQTLVVVDNAEDMDPVQAGVLAVLAGPSTPLILAVDPDRQVYGFRGARLTPSAGAMVCLQRGFDVAGAVEAACGPLRQRLPLPPGTALGALDAYRHLTPDRPGEAAKVVFTDSLAEAGWVATRLRHARLTDGIAWEDMAVLVRRRSDFARYEVACEAAGVPVVVSGDEIQLGAEPIVTVLLAALRLVRDGEAGSPHDVATVAGSPLGPSAVVAAGTGSVADALWALWETSPWQAALLAQAETPGVAALKANRALDAVVALAHLAGTYADLGVDKGITALDAAVRSQEVPEDLPRSSSWSATAVRLTTAHRAKAGDWSVVVVGGVQDGVWPARPPGVPLVSTAGLVAEPVDERGRLAAERRLLYAACASAKQRLIVTAVDSEDESPSVFFDQIDADIRLVATGAPAETLTAPALTGRLRWVVADESAPPGLRQAACDRLARLSGRPGFGGADPATWWGTAPPPGARQSPAGVSLAASGVESLLDCPRQWYLRESGASRPVGARTQIGSLVHQLVQDPDAALDTLLARLDEAWGGLEFPAAWQAAAELDGARSALARYDAYRRAGFREVSAVEAGVDYTVEAGGPVRVRGRIDRIVRDRRGASWVVDFKTGGTAPARAQAARNLQLGLYQLALQTAAAEPVAGAELVFLRLPDTRGSAYPKVLAQASLADQPYLAGSAPLPVADARVVVVGDQRDYPTWVHYRLAAAAAVVRQGTYPALPGPPCRGCAFTRGCPGRGEA